MNRNRSTSTRWIEYGILGAVCALVFGVYAITARPGPKETLNLSSADDYYNLLVQGFRDGRLSLKKEVPSGFAQLADPYDPNANIRYRSWLMDDLTYYKGRLYLYYGVTPALIVFWPYAALTGHYLSHRLAVLIFCAIGFLVSVLLLHAVWRRYFASVSVWMVAAGALALGLATFVPMLLARCEVYEVAISCGYMLTMLALGAIWGGLHQPERQWRWLTAASLAYGLAVAARPSLLFGAVILLAPVVQAWRERRPIRPLLIAATGPIFLIGCGLMWYNARRFESPFEFGLRYSLAGDRPSTQQWFSPRYLWFNFRVYFLEPARWSSRFSYVQDITVPPLPAGHGLVEHPFGILPNIPFVWMALAVPLAWRGRTAETPSILSRFITVATVLVLICALTVSFFFSASSRYEVDFIPALVLLAVIGMLNVETALARRPARLRFARWGCSLLLGFSVAFNLLASVKYYAETDKWVGVYLAQMHRLPEAVHYYEQALRVNPDYSEAHYSLGVALIQMGRVSDGMEHLEKSLRLNPSDANAQNSLGVALAQTGKSAEAITHYEQALRLNPELADAYCNLAVILSQTGRNQEAIGHLEQALRINPDLPGVHHNLAVVFARVGHIDDAIAQYQQELRIDPDDARAHNDLGGVLERAGRIPEAIEQYEQALRIQPDLAAARQSLVRLQAGR